MTHLEIAQQIANSIDTRTQGEIEAMMDIVCATTDIEIKWLHPVVGNLYAKLNPSVMHSGANIDASVNYN